MEQSLIPRRNYGIDLLRIVSMLMVALLHVNWQGGVFGNSEWLSVNYEGAWFLESAAFCAVNCYGLISGYVGITAKQYRYSGLAQLWLQVVYYSVMITVLFAIVSPQTVGWGRVLESFFPVCNDYYWYFTAYFALYLCLPALNWLVHHWSESQLAVLCVTLAVLSSLLPTVAKRNLFQLNEGYSPLWLGVLYLVGACIRKFGWFRRVKRWILGAVYGGAVLVTWGWKYLLEALGTDSLRNVLPSGLLYNYVSPSVFVASVALLLFFISLDNLPKPITACISFLAPVSFSVYLIHVHPLVWSAFMHDRFAPLAEAPAGLTVLYILLAATGLYLFCSAVDLPRHYLFRRLKLKERLNAWEDRIRTRIRNCGSEKEKE